MNECDVVAVCPVFFLIGRHVKRVQSATMRLSSAFLNPVFEACQWMQEAFDIWVSMIAFA
jgi:hypothetical protein